MTGAPTRVLHHLPSSAMHTPSSIGSSGLCLARAPPSLMMAPDPTPDANAHLTSPPLASPFALVPPPWTAPGEQAPKHQAAVRLHPPCRQLTSGHDSVPFNLRELHVSSPVLSDSTIGRIDHSFEPSPPVPNRPDHVAVEEFSPINLLPLRPLRSVQRAPSCA
jgi:hypothetical protein